MKPVINNIYKCRNGATVFITHHSHDKKSYSGNVVLGDLLFENIDFTNDGKRIGNQNYDLIQNLSNNTTDEYKIREDVANEFLKYIASVMGPGAKKHGDENWMQPNGNKSSHKEMHDSIQHHLSDSFAGGLIDPDDNCHYLAKVATRALMLLYIKLHNIRND